MGIRRTGPAIVQDGRGRGCRASSVTQTVGRPSPYSNRRLREGGRLLVDIARPAQNTIASGEHTTRRKAAYRAPAPTCLLLGIATLVRLNAEAGLGAALGLEHREAHSGCRLN
jgi:hypothetical protein